MSLLTNKEHLPQVVTSVNGISDVLNAISPEIEDLRANLINLRKELYIKTANKLISKWEKDFKIPSNTSLSLAERKQKVLNLIVQKSTLNNKNLKNLIYSIIGTYQFYILNFPSQYKFNIQIPTDYNIDILISTLNEVKPAHLTYELEIVGVYNRHCGTFTCGTNPL